MTESRPTTRFEAGVPRTILLANVKRPMQLGMAGLGLGAGLTLLAVGWSHATLGLVSLIVVFGSLASVSLGLMRRLGTRFRRH